MRSQVVAFALAAGLLLLLPQEALAAELPSIDDAVSLKMRTAPESVIDVMLHLENTMLSDGERGERWAGKSRSEKRAAIFEQKQKVAVASQSQLAGILVEFSVNFRSFWATNTVAVYGVKVKTLAAVLGKCTDETEDSCGLVSIMPRPFYTRNSGALLEHRSSESSSSGVISDDVQPNIKRVRAPDAWALGFNGTGVVVGTLDGGVRYTHEALVDGYRGTVGSSGGEYEFDHDYNWHDWAYARSYPDDNDGHGTNVQGIATGGLGLGVAPGAQWISGRIFNAAGYAAGDWILAGVEWMMCPTTIDDVNASEPDCSRGADVVSCSWGIGQADPLLAPAIAAWTDAGMVPVFAVGNDGSEGCQTSYSPADYRGVIGVGASEVKYKSRVDVGDDVCAFSSRGPALVNETASSYVDSVFSSQVPSLVAPGYDIEGPSYESDTKTLGFTGTSQATPHVAGAAAILLGAYPSLTVDEVSSRIFQGTNRTSLQEPSGSGSCAGVEWSTYPNYISGYGRLDCASAVGGEAPAAGQGATAGSVTMEPDASLATPPRFWKQGARASDADVVRCIFTFRTDPSALREFERTLYSVSDPRSPRYGRFLSRKEVSDRLGASDAAIETVSAFLRQFSSADVRVSELRDKVHVAMPARVAEKMLETRFHRYTSTVREGVTLLRVSQSYSLPAEVAAVVSLVDDILRFPSVRVSTASQRGDPGVGAAAAAAAAVGGDSPFASCGVLCEDKTTPDVLKEAYGIQFPVSEVSSTDPGAAVAEFQGEYYDEKDLANFDSACGTQINVTSVVGGNNAERCEVGGCGEGLLDIEYLGSLTYPLNLTTVYATAYSLQAWADTVASMDNPPLVHSVSYGNDEVEQDSAAYMEAVNQQFMALGAMGVSILFASGDQGVWGRTGNTGKGAVYNPDFPASSPYVTSVGGTNFKQMSVIGEESTWNCGGGGFSDQFGIPNFQASDVASYLKTAGRSNLLPDSAVYNSSGRAYPDIAALAGATNEYCISTHGGDRMTGVAGTSAATPVAAAVFAQLNNERSLAGKAALGWLNPFIYQNGGCFNDINDQSRNGCSASMDDGFAAISGWDPATGLGTPDYECLSKAAKKVA